MNDAAAWMAVLEQIEQSLAQSLARNSEVPPAARPEADADETLADLMQRFEQRRACLERVEQAAAAEEEDLDADLKPIREWLAAAAAARERLRA